MEKRRILLCAHFCSAEEGRLQERGCLGATPHPPAASGGGSVRRSDGDRHGDGEGTAVTPCACPHHKKKAQGSNASSTWGLPCATPAPSGDPLTPGKCNGEFLQPPPAPDSHQVSEARSKAEPSCRAIPPRPPPARGIAVLGGGMWRRWGGQRGWGPPAAPGYPPCPSRCCPPAWPQLARGLV